MKLPTTAIQKCNVSSSPGQKRTTRIALQDRESETPPGLGDIDTLARKGGISDGQEISNFCANGLFQNRHLVEPVVVTGVVEKSQRLVRGAATE